ncbi:MFS transporter [Peribacillus muralis]|nr:MFS transporter [Peribacillus muralis]MCK2012880.1 MFS transporter [Peribacillus muralis]
MGFFQSIYSVGIFFGPVMMGILAQTFSRETSFLVIAILSAIAAIATRFLLKLIYLKKYLSKKPATINMVLVKSVKMILLNFIFIMGIIE